MAVEGPEFERAFRGAIQYALNSGFSEILELRPVQEEALLHFIKHEDVFAVLPTGCDKSLIFQLVLLEDDVASHSIVFTSPELIVREQKWRKVLQSKSFLLLLKRLLSC